MIINGALGCGLKTEGKMPEHTNMGHHSKCPSRHAVLDLMKIINLTDGHELYQSYGKLSTDVSILVGSFHILKLKIGCLTLIICNLARSKEV